MILPDGTSLQSLGLPVEQVWPVDPRVLTITLFTPNQNIVIPFSAAERLELETDGLLLKRMISDPAAALAGLVELLFYVPR